MELINQQDTQHAPIQLRKDELEHEVVQPISEYPQEKYPSQKFILIISTMS